MEGYQDDGKGVGVGQGGPSGETYGSDPHMRHVGVGQGVQQSDPACYNMHNVSGLLMAISLLPRMVHISNSRVSDGVTSHVVSSRIYF